MKRGKNHQSTRQRQLHQAAINVLSLLEDDEFISLFNFAFETKEKPPEKGLHFLRSTT